MIRATQNLEHCESFLFVFSLFSWLQRTITYCLPVIMPLIMPPKFIIMKWKRGSRPQASPTTLPQVPLPLFTHQHFPAANTSNFVQRIFVDFSILPTPPIKQLRDKWTPARQQRTMKYAAEPVLPENILASYNQLHNFRVKATTPWKTAGDSSVIHVKVNRIYVRPVLRVKAYKTLVGT